MKRTMRLPCASAVLAASLSGGAVHAAMDSGGVMENYADIAHAMYEDSLNAARELEWMTAQWADDGAARQALADGGADAGLPTILTGLGSLSYGELAGVRVQLGLRR